MPLSFTGRTIGDISIVRCHGRIVEGAESSALRNYVSDVLEHTPAIVLDLGEVDFIDSSGLGMLVRILARTGRDNLKLCGLNGRITETLKLTRLAAIFECHDSEADAIAGFYRSTIGSSRPSSFVAPNVLCVGKSVEVLTYVRELLRQAGLSVTTIDNLPDAVTLLKATTPKVVLVDHDLRATGSSGTIAIFNRLVGTLAVVELPSDFARQDPIETAPPLVERVRILIDGVA
jgi:anti-sigma B factor antagonist